METSLHRTLKEQYGSGSGGRSEVVLKGFRVDALRDTGLVVEIQSGALGPLRSKLHRLLPEHQVQVVKPVTIQRRLIRRARVDGPDLSARRSPKRGAIVDVFEDLVGLAKLLPDPNLILEVLSVAIDEVRIPRRRWPGYQIADRCLIKILERRQIQSPTDLWTLLPDGHDWTAPFTTADIARRIDRPLWFAQRVGYCLRLSGAATIVGKRGNHRLYVSMSMKKPNDHCEPLARN
jgi:hypothetical protein